ncbi:hypothetical protein AB0K16_22100 [Nonomuraea jabiensis]|uniref:hypothetical protein n=1 Tax=Nonomuraea jabiensis TaxID=882448 RepID=UPI00341D8F02
MSDSVYVTVATYLGSGQEVRAIKGVSLSQSAAISRLQEHLKRKYLVPIVDTEYDWADLTVRQHQAEYQREEVWFSKDGTFAFYGALRWTIEEYVTDRDLL